MEIRILCVDCVLLGMKVTFSEVANRLSWSVAHVFIPLLFLMYEGYLELHQDTFFGEVYIEPNAASYAAMQNGAGLSTT